MPVSEWLLSNLACPRDRLPVGPDGSHLVCAAGHRYVVAQGVPLMLLEPTEIVEQLVAQAERDWPPREPSGADPIDPFVRHEIAATNGNMFHEARVRMREYPIPELTMREGGGKRLVDIGCNWGRWVVAAARRGYRPVGVDPKIVSVLAAQRVCRQLGVDASFVAGDGRALPFRSGCFEAAHSYSVIQHMPRKDAALTFAEMSRVSGPDAEITVQMPRRGGLWWLYQKHRAPLGPDSDEFGPVRAYSIAELRQIFDRWVGPSTVEVHGFFTIQAGLDGLPIVATKFKALLLASEALRWASVPLPVLKHFCDSVFVHARNRVGGRESVALPATPAANTIELLNRTSG